MVRPAEEEASVDAHFASFGHYEAEAKRLLAEKKKIPL